MVQRLKAQCGGHILTQLACSYDNIFKNNLSCVTSVTIYPVCNFVKSVTYSIDICAVFHSLCFTLSRKCTPKLIFMLVELLLNIVNILKINLKKLVYNKNTFISMYQSMSIVLCLCFSCSFYNWCRSYRAIIL